ncbi:MAG: VOC family protein [Deltaproteobacteria bacterium]|nr:VOC family protein [Deltaproteobacteria bacterium]
MDNKTHPHHGVDYIELAAPDLDAIKSFFGAAFGWQFKDWGPDYIDFAGPGLAGGFRRESPKIGGALVILYSTDLPASLAAVKKAGGTVTKPTFEFPGGKRFHFADPAGHEWAVWSDR